MPSIRDSILHIILNNIQTLALLSHDMRHIPKQFIELTNALLDVAYLGFAFNNQGFLEINLVLGRESDLFLLLLLLLLWIVGVAGKVGGVAGVEGGARGGCRGSLLLER